MIDQLLSIIAPHHCSGCGIIGTKLCDNCKYDIISEPFSACVSCGKQLAPASGLCGVCRVPYERAWCVADRRDHLESLINDFKFSNTRAAHGPLADLLHSHLPELPKNTIIVPIPTVGSHIRQRGYDHMLLVARKFSRLRRLSVDLSLSRATNTTQRGMGVRVRVSQAKSAFVCRKKLNPNATYLLIDDVITTGATVKYAAQTLLDAGAVRVWVASISRQTLD